jgi:hypothetical protein
VIEIAAAHTITAAEFCDSPGGAVSSVARIFPQPKKNLHQRILQHAKKGGPLWAAEKKTTKI